MKKDKEKKDVDLPDSVIRLLDFVESHGGIAKVARTMGVTTQVFYNYRNGLSKPGTDFYIDIKKSYADFDANFILFGENSSTLRPEIEKDFEYLKRENGILRALVEAKGVDLGKCKGVSNSPKLYDVFGDFSVLLHRNNAAVCLPIYSN